MATNHLRLLHRILAKCILNVVNLNNRQKAFIAADGCAENTFLLDYIVGDARKHHKKLSIVGIDLAKGFNSVPIHSIHRALRRHNIDQALRTYIIDAYSNATTTISCGQTTTSGIKLLRGVKQGDPLSPILFNLILDELLDSLPSHIGVKVGESSINSLAFADDLILTSETPTGMGHLISLTKDFFNKRNMSINVKKCFSMRMTTSESRTL